MLTNSEQARVLNELSELCHAANRRWWGDLTKPCMYCSTQGCSACEFIGYTKKQRNIGELLMLCTSELAEAMEGHRKNLMDTHLPHRPMIEVELADCLIRIFDLCAGLKLDVGGAFVEKTGYNAQRADHKIEARLAPGGKQY